MSKKKIILILSVTVTLWALFLFGTKLANVKKDSGEEKELEERDTGELPVESEEFSLSMDDLYQSLPKPLNSHIPENSSYQVEYLDDLSVFSVEIDADNWEDFVIKAKDALFFFQQFKLEPCKEPLVYGIFWTALDLSKIDMADKNLLSEICGLD
jgi:hypothetical protein